MSTFVPQGKIELIKDVDIDVSYTHQYYFSNTDAQDLFFESKVFKTLEDGTYQRKNLGSLMVNYNVDEIRECKYIRWQNKPYSTKMYYAFVTSIDYENPKTSRINYVLDVYQTYLFDMEWKQSFIEREHCNRFDSKGDPLTNIEDEGLDIGDSYELLTNDSVRQFNVDIRFLVLGTTSEKILPKKTREIGSIPTPITYLIVPFLGLTTNASFKLGDNELASIEQVLNIFRTNQTYVNSLVSAYITPYLPIADIQLTTEGTYYVLRSSALELAHLLINPVETTTKEVIAVKTTYTSYYGNFLKTIGSKYVDFPEYTESKLYMYPYSFTEISTLRGDSIIVKNEYINNSMLKLDIKGVISNKNNLKVGVSNYLIKEDAGESDLEQSLVDLSDTSIPIVDDYTASYLQSNSNANKVAIQNARNSMETTIANSDRSFNTSMANRDTNMVGGLIKTLGQVAIAGGMAGLSDSSASAMKMVGGAMNTIIDTGVSYMNAERNAQLSQANTLASAKTDYNNTQATILAKVKDAQQIPANARALGGDYLFDNLLNTYGIYIRKKTIRKEYADKLTDYFKQYGYKVNRLEVPNFKTRQNWNYIKMAEPNIYGNIPMDDLTQLKDIFSNGITLWHGDYIGDYSLANMEVE